MAKHNTPTRQQLAAAKAWMAEKPFVTGVKIGFKVTKGQQTKEQCLVFSVKKKASKLDILPGDLIPDRFGESRTDVVEAEYKSYELTQRRRPCPGGFSIGHWPLVSAGTFGCVAYRNSDNKMVVVSNNHVLAASNEAKPGDFVIQAAKADGGRHPSDWFGSDIQYVTIHPDGETPTKKNNALARAWWTVGKGTMRFIGGIFNLGAFSVRCPFRVSVGPLAIDQPSPNLVDIAYCVPVDGAALDVIEFIGPVLGLRAVTLGERIKKTGRTTEHTRGPCSGIGARVRVNYGDFIATFDPCRTFRGDTGDLSAGGDSGSAILGEDDDMLSDFLFAGGGGETIGCDAATALSYLGLHIA